MTSSYRPVFWKPDRSATVESESSAAKAGRAIIRLKNRGVRNLYFICRLPKRIEVEGRIVKTASLQFKQLLIGLRPCRILSFGRGCPRRPENDASSHFQRLPMKLSIINCARRTFELPAVVACLVALGFSTAAAAPKVAKT